MRTVYEGKTRKEGRRRREEEGRKRKEERRKSEGLGKCCGFSIRRKEGRKERRQGKGKW